MWWFEDEEVQKSIMKFLYGDPPSSILKFICPECKKEYYFDKNTVYVTIPQAGGEFEYCSEKCLFDRIECLTSEKLFEYVPENCLLNGAKYNIDVNKISDSPISYEIIYLDYEK